MLTDLVIKHHIYYRKVNIPSTYIEISLKISAAFLLFWVFILWKLEESENNLVEFFI
jgi:hypothetical protein